MSYSVCRDPESGSTIRLAEHYSKYGFVVAEDLLPHTTVLSLLEEMTAICRGKRGPIPGILPYDSKHTDEEVLQNYLCIHFPHKVSEMVRDLVKEPTTVSVLQQLIGPNIKAMQTMMFMKGPGKRGQACHQDEYYIPTRDRSLCASWVALDDATVENGCIWIIPKSHQKRVSILG
jgi:ectoine hydroxylase-related dioxygenase (phytanoyl-CoA dioxygenase family)